VWYTVVMAEKEKPKGFDAGNFETWDIAGFILENLSIIIVLVGLAILFFAIQTYNLDPLHTVLIVVGFLLPIPLSGAALTLWHHYRQDQFILGIKWTLLEIQVPRDVIKSPAAMELIFSNALYHQSGKGFYEQYIVGAPWLWFSLEIASIDGQVHFYIRTPTRLRNIVETQIYAQYPQAKVVEVEDYALAVPQYKKDGDWSVWGAEFKKEKADFLPIKTYRGFGDDLKTGVKEEFKIDPITPTIEYLGSLPKGQQLWMQIIVRWNKTTYHSHHTGGHLKFPDAAQEFMLHLLQPFSRAQKDEEHSGQFGVDVRAPATITPVIKAITDQVNQIHFDCGIRIVTLSDNRLCTNDQFMNLRRDARLLFRQYAQPGINEMARINSTQFDAPWSDPTGLALTKMKKRMLDWYRMRIMFHPPIQYSFKYPGLIANFFPSGAPKPFVFSAEELATLYHFPGLVSGTPSFKRIESKIAKPPADLPI
jgi:hypothetical protein